MVQPISLGVSIYVLLTYIETRKNTLLLSCVYYCVRFVGSTWVCKWYLCTKTYTNISIVRYCVMFETLNQQNAQTYSLDIYITISR